MKDLRVLDLSGSLVTDSGLERLTSLTGLMKLSVAHAAITDRSITVLISFRDLRTLDVQGTEISQDGLERLIQGLPDCDIRSPTMNAR